MIATAGEAPLPGSLTDLFDLYSRRRFRERCRELLLDPLESQVFGLRYGQGFTPQEIARMLAQSGNAPDPPFTARRVSDMLERCFRRFSVDPEIRELLRGD